MLMYFVRYTPVTNQYMDQMPQKMPSFSFFVLSSSALVVFSASIIAWILSYALAEAPGAWSGELSRLQSGGDEFIQR